MKAFVVAGGRGARLQPVTAHTRKPLLPVADVPAIVYSLLQLRRAGVTQTVVNAHHLAPALESFLQAHDFGFEIIISYEPELLGTGGLMMRAAT